MASNGEAHIQDVVRSASDAPIIDSCEYPRPSLSRAVSRRTIIAFGLLKALLSGEYRDRSNVGYGTALAEFYLIAIIVFITIALLVTRRWVGRYSTARAVEDRA